MGAEANDMVRKGVDATLNGDTELAARVIEARGVRREASATCRLEPARLVSRCGGTMPQNAGVVALVMAVTMAGFVTLVTIARRGRAGITLIG